MRNILIVGSSKQCIEDEYWLIRSNYLDETDIKIKIKRNSFDDRITYFRVGNDTTYFFSILTSDCFQYESLNIDESRIVGILGKTIQSLYVKTKVRGGSFFIKDTEFNIKK